VKNNIILSSYTDTIYNILIDDINIRKQDNNVFNIHIDYNTIPDYISRILYILYDVYLGEDIFYIMKLSITYLKRTNIKVTKSNIITLLTISLLLGYKYHIDDVVDIEHLYYIFLKLNKYICFYLEIEYFASLDYNCSI
jgi:hypothetical protein